MAEKMNIVYLHAETTYDLTPTVWELGFLRNNGGNHSLLPLPNNHWLCSFRVFAYWIDYRGAYLFNKNTIIDNPDEMILVELDESFELVRRFRCVRNTYYLEHKECREKPYLEDTRLHVWDGKIYAISTLCEQKDGRWVNSGLEVQKIDIDFEDGTFSATHFWNTIENSMRGIEKNWMPVEGKPFNYVAETWDEGAHIRDISNGTETWAGNLSIDPFYRGNTPLVKDCFRKCYYAIVHNVKDPDDEHPVKFYENHFVKFDENLVPVKFSKPFHLTEAPIEFVTDFKMYGDIVQIGVTENDARPLVMKFNRHDLFEEIGFRI